MVPVERALRVFSLAFVLIALPQTARAQTTALFVSSQAGDSVGQGKTATYTTADKTFTTFVSANDVTISLGGPGLPFWRLTFSGPGGTVPGPGVYEAARRAPFTRFNGLDVSGVSGCNDLTGRFVVLEAVYAGGNVVRFAADFEQHCGDADAGIFGAIRYNSTVSSLAPFGGAYPTYRIALTPPVNGTITGAGVNCGPAGAQCVYVQPAPTSTTLLATPAPGYIFAGWTGDCIGGPRATVHVNMLRNCSAAFTPLIVGAPRTIALVSSGPHSLTLGESYVLSPANSIWTVVGSPRGFSTLRGFEIQIEFLGTRTQETLDFQLEAPSGEAFEMGHEYQTKSLRDATHASLWSSIEASGCSDPGTLAVRDWRADASGIVPYELAMDFLQSCGDGLAVTLQYQSIVTLSELVVDTSAMHFTATGTSSGIVGHSRAQPFHLTRAGYSPVSWQLATDQPWLAATPPSGTDPSTASVNVKNGPLYNPLVPGHVQVLARGAVNLPDPITVTLDLVPPDTTSYPFGVYRPSSGMWFAPNQAPAQLGLPGDLPLTGDFDGDGLPEHAIYRRTTGQWFVAGQGVTSWGLPGDIPVAGDYDGDGVTDLAVFRRGTPALWFIRGEALPRQLGVRGDIPVPADYDGDGTIDIAVFHPPTGSWQIVLSSTGQTVTKVLGARGDVPLAADFDFDGMADLAVFRPSTGTWFISFSHGGNIYSRQFGLPGDVPVAMDSTGDGHADLRVWRPETGMWFTYNFWTGQVSFQPYGLPGDIPVAATLAARRRVDADVDGDRASDATVFRAATGEWFTRRSSSGYALSSVVQWGLPEDLPVPGDYDGVLHQESAVYRPSTGEWFVRRFDGTLLYRQWGLPDDVPVPADYDGDGRTDMAVYRPSTGEWYVLTSATGHTQYQRVAWGLPGDVPMPGDYDGDGRADAAVYRPSTGEWFIRLSSGGSMYRVLGASGDVPLVRDFDGDGRADVAVFRPATGEWFAIDAFDAVSAWHWGEPGDVPAADDYDGDGAADIAVFRPSTGEWFVIRSSDGLLLYLQWGLPGDVPVVRR